jgi:hypothetical protein
LTKHASPPPSLQQLAQRVIARERGWGVIFQPGALWIGAHYSRLNRRWCINVLPCLTVWFTLRGGKVPARSGLT